MTRDEAMRVIERHGARAWNPTTRVRQCALQRSADGWRVHLESGAGVDASAEAPKITDAVKAAWERLRVHVPDEELLRGGE